MEKVLDLITCRMGWVIIVIFGGPDMSKVNGEITARTYHVGMPKG